jgi:hypothetical protein
LRQKFLTLLGNGQLAQQLGAAFARSGYPEVLRLCLEDMQVKASVRYLPPLQVAQLYVRLGNNHNAMQWLEKAYADGAVYSIHLHVMPTWDDLRALPQFADLLRRIGLPE